MNVQRWIFHDPFAPETWTVPMNPSEMSSIFPEKNISTNATTALTGQVLLFEGATTPVNWNFQGTTLDRAHHDELLRWSQKRNRIRITDHFGRVIPVYLVNFDAIPQPAPQTPRKWRHTYTMTAIIVGQPSAATVGD